MAGFNPQNSAKIRFGGIDNRRLFTIYIWMGKPRSVHGLGKWYVKFRTGKFRPGIAFTVCTNCMNQFHLPENDCGGLKLASKMALK